MLTIVLAQHEKRNLNNWLIFSYLIDFYFKLKCSHLFFISTKKWKMKKIHYSFFIFMKELKNELLKKNKINFSFFHKHGLHVNQEQVRVKSNETSRCTMSTWTPRICCLENSQCILCLYYSLLLSYFVLLL